MLVGNNTNVPSSKMLFYHLMCVVLIFKSGDKRGCICLQKSVLPIPALNFGNMSPVNFLCRLFIMPVSISAWV